MFIFNTSTTYSQVLKLSSFSTTIDHTLMFTTCLFIAAVALVVLAISGYWRIEGQIEKIREEARVRHKLLPQSAFLGESENARTMRKADEYDEENGSYLWYALSQIAINTFILITGIACLIWAICRLLF